MPNLITFEEGRNREYGGHFRPGIYGEANYDGICTAFFAALPERAVNTRLMREREAREWRARGGMILEIRRPGVGPATRWEAERLEELRAAGLIDATLRNDGNRHDLHARLLEWMGLEEVQ